MKRHAFLIGRNGPAASKLDNLKYAESDAGRMGELLKGSAAGFDDVVVAERSADAPNCLAQFERISAGCGFDDVLLFYFSGHGHIPRGELFLLFPQTDTSRLVSTALPIMAVKAVMAQSKARVRILILDCCHSGAAGRETLRSGHRPQELPLVEAARDSASIIIAACGRNVVTRERAEFGGGFLTQLFSQALDGESADADIDRDGLLSVTDFIEWASRQTAKLNTQRRDLIMEAPEMYGDLRSQVYLTASRFLVRDDELNRQVLDQVVKIRETFAKQKWVEPEDLQKLARPIKSAAPTFTSLAVLDELFRKRDDASIFAAATILQIRRDPRYMSVLVAHVNDPKLRGAANWRVLRAIRDTISRYEFSESGRRDFVKRLREAAIKRDTRSGPPFSKGTALSMILQIAKRLKIPPQEVFSSEQLKSLARSKR